MRPSIAVQQHRTEILAMLQKYRSQTHGSLDQLYVPLYEGVRHEFYDNDDLREWLVQYFDDYVVENQPVKGTYGLIWFLSKQNSIPGSFAPTAGILGSITASTWAIWQHCPTNASPEYEVSCNLLDCLISKRAIVRWVKPVKPVLSH